MKRFLITVSALSLLAAPAVSIAQATNPDREARRAERQAARQAGEGPSQEEREARRAARQADGQADAAGEQRAQRQAEAEAAAQAGQVDSELLARDRAARAEAEANLRRVEAGQPRVGEDRVRPEDRRYERQEDRRDRREARQPNTPPGMVVPPTFNEGRDDRWDRRDDRREFRQDRREDRRDYRQDRRGDRREFRQERRQRTFEYRGRNYSAYRAPAYRWSSGIRSRNWIVGAFLPAPLITQNYVVRDYWNYDLPRPPLGTYYVRVDTDVYLVAVRGGRVIDVIRDVFYYDDGYGYGW